MDIQFWETQKGRLDDEFVVVILLHVQRSCLENVEELAVRIAANDVKIRPIEADMYCQNVSHVASTVSWYERPDIRATVHIITTTVRQRENTNASFSAGLIFTFHISRHGMKRTIY